MNKSQYREYFRELSYYIKLSKCLPGKVSNVNLSRFMKSEEYDFVFSLETLELIRKNIIDILLKLVD